MNLNDLQTVVHKLAIEKGWWEGGTNNLTPKDVAAKLALIHSEVSEILEAVRETGTDSWTDEKGKPLGFGPEMADVLIRLCDLAEATKVDLAYWVDRKHNYNRTRPFKHGNKAI